MILRPDTHQWLKHSVHKHGIINFIIEDHVLAAVTNINLCLDLFLPKYSRQWFFLVPEARVLQSSVQTGNKWHKTYCSINL